MAMSSDLQLRYWGAAALAFAAVLWVLGDMLLPFVTGAAIAYFLNPLVTKLTRVGAPRALAVAILMLTAIGLIVLAGLLVIPVVISQAVQFSATVPDLLARLQEFLSARFPNLSGLEDTLQTSLATMGEAIRDRGAELAQGVWRSVSGLVSALIFLVITPVVAFYLLLDWPRVLKGADDLLPRQHAPVIRDLAGQIDRSIAGFVRGQVTVCLILAVYYATALGLVGLQFGLAIGVTAGLISFVPYIGAILGGVLAIGVALWQFWDTPSSIAIVVVIFVIGQILEGNILVPRIVGHSVRLHPVWLLFAISSFGMLFGFTGMLIAVPLAASVGVLVRFGLAQYQASSLYRAPQADPPPHNDMHP
ncbi:AI-2E family transporter [Roseinatronobacter monicus]|uniref:Putative PurR-regulated permease PerM n=1 Tax=Roseinatronobacter monicus TaxID=393481 RepID=A0A543K912_9RHOB|nr:AI-2E family transporter [Roseinatronobacter monicus]TQM91565.1 putative PurR-regulated permease PerM [Roseinatronobacter monicus]